MDDTERVEIHLSFGASAFVLGSTVTFYALGNLGIRGAGYALGYPEHVTVGMAALCPLPLATAVFAICTYRMLPFLYRNLRRTSEPKGYESELKPVIHDWRSEVVQHKPRIYERNGRGVAVSFFPEGITYDDLRRVASTVVGLQRSFSHKALVPQAISRPKMDRLQAWFLDRGWAERKGAAKNAPVELTGTGRAVMESYFHSPTRPASMLTKKV